MKKLLALMLALVMVFSLAACAEKDNDDDRSDDRNSKPSSGSGSWWDDLPEDGDDKDEDKDKEDDDENSSVISPPSDEPDKNEDTVSAVVTVGEHNLTATDFTYFYMDELSEYQNTIYEQYYPSVGNYWSTMLGFDPELPLDEQVYSEETGETWMDHFKDLTVESMHLNYALYDAALADDYSLPADVQLAVDEYLDSLEEYASYYGYDNCDAYVRAYYGKDATEASFHEYYTMRALISSYWEQHFTSLTFSAAELQAFEMSSDYYSTLSDAKMVNVRHILAIFEDSTDAGKAAAKAKADQLLQQWKNGPATEASFGELANAESDDQDGNVTNGGLYENIYPGQMVKNFESWCFAADRKPGDTGIVETEYGYHVMYFSSYAEMSYRDMIVDNDIRIERTEQWTESLMDQTPIVLGDLDSLELE